MRTSLAGRFGFLHAKTVQQRAANRFVARDFSSTLRAIGQVRCDQNGCLFVNGAARIGGQPFVAGVITRHLGILHFTPQFL